MNESEIAAGWGELEPTPRQRRRMDVRVRDWLDARETSLVAEWRGLITVNPIAGLSFAALAASLMLLATPLSWVAFSVL